MENLSGQPSAAQRPDPPSPSGPPTAPGGSGLAPNVAGALAYFLGALTGIVFLIIDRERPFVRFHAMQAILLTVAGIAISVALMVLSLILGAVPIIGWLVSLLLYVVLWIGAFVLWLYLMYRAFQGHEWELPYIGAHARRLASQA